MSSPPPDDFFELGPEHEIPEQPDNFSPLGPEHEIPEQPAVPLPAGGTILQWEAIIEITTPGGERRVQIIRVPREETDTEQDARDKLLLAQIEIESIIAERGGEYDVQADLTSIDAV